MENIDISFPSVVLPLGFGNLLYTPLDLGYEIFNSENILGLFEAGHLLSKSLVKYPIREIYKKDNKLINVLSSRGSSCGTVIYNKIIIL